MKLIFVLILVQEKNISKHILLWYLPYSTCKKLRKITYTYIFICTQRQCTFLSSLSKCYKYIYIYTTKLSMLSLFLTHKIIFTFGKLCPNMIVHIQASPCQKLVSSNIRQQVLWFPRAKMLLEWPTSKLVFSQRQRWL